jgi:hypothetical protein
MLNVEEELNHTVEKWYSYPNFSSMEVVLDSI